MAFKHFSKVSERQRPLLTNKECLNIETNK